MKTWRGIEGENRFGRWIMGGLMMSNLLALSALFIKDDPVIVIPPSLHEEVRISQNKASGSLKEAWGLFIAELLGNVTPSNNRFIEAAIAPLLDARIYPTVMTALWDQIEALKVDRITLTFKPHGVFYEAETDKVFISGDQIKTASSGFDQQSAAYVVDLEFKDEAAKTWGDFTAANIGTQTAFTLDSKVVSAPQIREAIPGGRTQISGGDPPFTVDSARTLANVLKYGSLPLSFESSEAETVSATLGLTSLKAGLIAGAIGLALVLLYSLLYYRVLGFLIALSLIASAAMVFGILVLLGRYINYTLDLAGIAGLIIGIGTTADSFVVFFERIKDEIREGRSFRSAVPRGWVRARKTILSGNAVSFLAAAVLYFLAVGQVKGFAFTLGLTTILDTVIVFLLTWPMVFLASKSPTMAKPAFNGLGAVQEIARERRAVAAATGRG